MTFVVPDFMPATAEIFTIVMILFILLISAFMQSKARSVAFALSLFTLVGAAAATLYTRFVIVGLEAAKQTFSGLYTSDSLGDFLKLLIYLSVASVFIYGRGYLHARKIDRPEYYVLALFMTLGTMILVSASSMITLYIGLEMMSLALYALIAISRDRSQSTEAAMKYFVLGAMASGLLLYGLSMLYGAAGSLDMSTVAQNIYAGNVNRVVMLFGMVFAIAGICFKLGVVPFHMWVPDVYQGAPTPVTQLLAATAKVAAFGMAMRLLVFTLFNYAEQWQMMLGFVALASLVLGNIAAISQTNLKRMLAYSGISHMGFVLLGLLSGVVMGDLQNVGNAYAMSLFYVVIYVLSSLAAFGVIIVLSRPGFEADELIDLKGLNQRSSWLAFMMLMVMFSMAGVPFFVGFFAKFAVLQALLVGSPMLALAAIAMSLVGLFYYLRVVKLMYFDDPVDAHPIQACFSIRILLTVNAAALAVLGLMPGRLMSFCSDAMRFALGAY